MSKPRVTLNPELRVPTRQPVSLGELPIALGVDYQSKRKATVPIDPPIERKGKVLSTTEEVKDAIRSSYRLKYEEGTMPDEGITGLVYQPHAGGRPSKYMPQRDPRIAFEFALVGLTDERIALAMGIDVTTFYVWCKEKPEFSQALVDGRERADREVANAMYKRATGFKYSAVKIFHNKDDGTVYAPYEEYMPPDVTAGKYWMSIRRGRQRKDGWDALPEGMEGGTAPPVQITINVSDPQEAAKQYREIMQLEHEPAA